MCDSQDCSPTHTAPLVIYAKAKWKSDYDRALRQAIDCNVDNTSGFKCLGPINTTKGLGRWIQTKAFFPLIYFYFSFLCRAIRDVWPINSSIHHASTHTPPSIHSAPHFEPSLSSSALPSLIENCGWLWLRQTLRNNFGIQWKHKLLYKQPQWVSASRQ